MNADDGLRLAATDDNVRRETVARSLDSLKRRQRAAPPEAALPDDPETGAREVARDEDPAARFRRAATLWLVLQCITTAPQICPARGRARKKIAGRSGAGVV